MEFSVLVARQNVLCDVTFLGREDNVILICTDVSFEAGRCTTLSVLQTRGNRLVKRRKETAGAKSRYYPGIYLERLRKTTK
jgi:hypothetical protein